MSPYFPLWNKSNFSFLEGASHPEELVDRAAELGLPGLALSDRDGVYGLVRAHAQARKHGLKLLLGAQVSVGSLDLLARIQRGDKRTPTSPLILLAQNREGYASLCRLLSIARSRCPKGSALSTPDEVAHASSGLLALSPDASLLAPLRDAFDDRLYALCSRHLHDDDPPREAAIRRAATSTQTPLVAANEVLYHHRARRPLQDVLSCIRLGTTLATAGRDIRGNDEHDLKAPSEMESRFADDPSLLARSLEVAERCNFSLSQLRYVYPEEKLPAGHSQEDWLHTLTFEGARRRFPAGIPSAVKAQIERELALIRELEYGGYFLTMYEIVQFCGREGILCQGRGSAANSVVCYCLGITAVDPIRLDLLFERFLSRERAEPPDIDLDIEHQRREEVIQWLYERHGRRHAAMVANFIRYRTRSAVRDVGKVIGLSLSNLERLSKLLGPHGGQLDAELLRQAGLDPDAPSLRPFIPLVESIREFPRHLSIHPGGFILGSDVIDTMVPIEPATMEARTVIQWDKYDVEELGLFKVDLLGLGALSHLHRCFDLLEKHRGIELGLASIPHDDAETYTLLSRGDTIGVFQVESRAQMAMLPRLRPQVFYDLVIEVAIVRPGPIQGDMVHPYLRRRKGQEDPEYPHPALEKVLAKTLGVPIFQEQVMKLAIAVADYTPGEADQLRRDMAAWRSSGRIDAHRERLLTRMVANGISPQFAERVFMQIQGFGEYGFPESHAASFALIAYATAYLRCHYPAAFTCSLLNAQPMGFYSAATLVEDAKRHGVQVRPVDALASEWDCTLEANGSDWAIRMGFRQIKGLGSRERLRLEALSDAPYPPRTLDEFTRRSRLSSQALSALARAGAFDCFSERGRRREALWSLRAIAPGARDSLALPLAPDAAPPELAPLAPPSEVIWDYRSSMHSARGHPMEALRSELTRRRLLSAKQVQSLPDGAPCQYAGLVICRQRPATASGVTFFTLEDESGVVNLVVWRPIFERHSLLARTASLLGVSGKIQSAEGVVHLIADTLWEPPFSLSSFTHRSRDFH